MIMNSISTVTVSVFSQFTHLTLLCSLNKDLLYGTEPWSTHNNGKKTDSGLLQLM